MAFLSIKCYCRGAISRFTLKRTRYCCLLETKDRGLLKFESRVSSIKNGRIRCFLLIQLKLETRVLILETRDSIKHKAVFTLRTTSYDIGRHRPVSLSRPVSSDVVRHRASRHPALSYDVVRSVNTA